MNKQILFIIAGVVGIIIFVSIYVFVLGQKPVQQSGSPTLLPSTYPTVVMITRPITDSTPIIANFSPEDTVKAFYSWYISYSGNPLFTGAYKTNQYLSEHFKQIVTHSLANRHAAIYDPVFCSKNKTNNFSVDHANDNNGAVVNVLIRRLTDGKGLYRVVLKNIDSKWLIDDIMCQP